MTDAADSESADERLRAKYADYARRFRFRRGHGVQPVHKLAIRMRDKFRCVYCNCKLNEPQCAVNLVLPPELGGDARYSNLVLGCKPCVKSKGRQRLEDWLLRSFPVKKAAVIAARVKAATERHIDMSVVHRQYKLRQKRANERKIQS